MDTAASRARAIAQVEYQRSPCAARCSPGAHIGGPGCRLGKSTAAARPTRATRRTPPPVAVPFEVWAAEDP